MNWKWKALVLALVIPGARLPAGEDPASVPVLAFRAARILPVEGPPVAPGVLLVKGGVVEKVLPAGEKLPGAAELVDLGDAWLIPGLVNPSSRILFRSGSRGRGSGVISSGEASPGDSRRTRVADQIDPESLALRRLGRSGYAALAVIPSGSQLLEGLAAVVRARVGDEREKVILKEEAYLSMAYGLGTPLREAAERELKKAAEAHKKAREGKGAGGAGEKKASQEKKEPAQKAEKPEKSGTPGEAEKAGASRPTEAAKAPPAAPEKPRPPDPLVQVFAGKLPAFIRVESAAALDYLFLILEDVPEPFRFVLLAPSLEPEMVERVAARRKSIRAVILEPRLGQIADTTIYYNTARLFQEAGMEVALTPLSDDLEGHGEIFYHLGELVKSGLPRDAALRAVTSVPAKLLGVDDRVGSLLPGREASFLVFQGDPLRGSARLLRVYLQGEEVYRDDPETGKASGEAVR